MNQPPNNNPRPQNDYDQRQLQNQEREAQRLRQEEARLRAAKRKQVFVWIRNTIILLVGSLEILLALRLFLRLSRANPENPFAQFILIFLAPSLLHSQRCLSALLMLMQLVFLT
jgi:YggT family protein